MTSLPGNFPSPESRYVICCRVTASSCELQPCRKWNGHYTPVFGLLQQLSGDFRSNDITSGHLKSRDIISCHATASSCDLQPCRVKRTVYASFRSSNTISKWLPVKWCLFRVTSAHLKPRDIIFCDVTASCCKLQPRRKSNAQHTPVFGLLQPLPDDFRANDVSSGSLPLTCSHVMWFFVTWLPPPASYSLVGSQMHSIRQFSAFYSHFQVTSSQMMSLPGHFHSSEVTWRDFLWRDCLLLQATAL